MGAGLGLSIQEGEQVGLDLPGEDLLGSALVGLHYEEHGGGGEGAPIHQAEVLEGGDAFEVPGEELAGELARPEAGVLLQGKELEAE